jgi:hypothetical protein
MAILSVSPPGDYREDGDHERSRHEDEVDLPEIPHGLLRSGLRPLCHLHNAPSAVEQILGLVDPFLCRLQPSCKICHQGHLSLSI